jgi:hypothetical protein
LDKLCHSCHDFGFLSSNFVGISTVVCGSFWGVEKIQNGGRCHGNQGTKWPPKYKNPPILGEIWYDPLCRNIHCSMWQLWGGVNKFKMSAIAMVTKV